MEHRCEHCGAVNTLDESQLTDRTDRGARPRCTSCGAVLRRRRRQLMPTPIYAPPTPVARFLPSQPPGLGLLSASAQSPTQPALRGTLSASAQSPTQPPRGALAPSALSETDLQRIGLALLSVSPAEPAPPPDGAAQRRISSPGMPIIGRGRPEEERPAEAHAEDAPGAPPSLRRAQEMARAALNRPTAPRPGKQGASQRSTALQFPAMGPAHAQAAPAAPPRRETKFLPALRVGRRPAAGAPEEAPGEDGASQAPARTDGAPGEGAHVIVGGPAAPAPAPAAAAAQAPEAIEKEPPSARTPLAPGTPLPPDREAPRPEPPPARPTTRLAVIPAPREEHQLLPAAAVTPDPALGAPPAAPPAQTAPPHATTLPHAAIGAEGDIGDEVTAAQLITLEVEDPNEPSTKIELSEEFYRELRAAEERILAEEMSAAPVLSSAPPPPPRSSPPQAPRRPQALEQGTPLEWARPEVAAPAPIAPSSASAAGAAVDALLLTSVAAPRPAPGGPPPREARPSPAPAPPVASAPPVIVQQRAATADLDPTAPEDRSWRPPARSQLELTPVVPIMRPAPPRSGWLLPSVGAALVGALVLGLALRGTLAEPGAASLRAQRALSEGQALFERGDATRFQEAHDLFFRALGADESDPRPLGALAELHMAWSQRLPWDAAEAARHRQLARSYANQALAMARRLPDESQRRLQVLAQEAAAPAPAAAPTQEVAAAPPQEVAAAPPQEVAAAPEATPAAAAATAPAVASAPAAAEPPVPTATATAVQAAPAPPPSLAAAPETAAAPAEAPAPAAQEPPAAADATEESAMEERLAAAAAGRPGAAAREEAGRRPRAGRAAPERPPAEDDDRNKPRGFREQMAQAKRLLDGRKPREAQRIYEQLLDKHEDNPELQAALGTCALRGERYQAATEHFRRALELREGHPAATLGLAETYRRRGDTARAIEWYRAYLKNPKGTGAKLARAQLERLEGQGQKGE